MGGGCTTIDAVMAVRNALWALADRGVSGDTDLMDPGPSVRLRQKTVAQLTGHWMPPGVLLMRNCSVSEATMSHAQGAV
ncbi:hypothetical protein QF035_010970 [Streptomyces umbrinus]|uniref:Uncharacterized protein n=1 Tax=Streptomyces umbrinus TaxID=67370 RepID=A0ABU0TC40_9ACTN|nr:hypothetical protein [Streptomyces umbrinus]